MINEYSPADNMSSAQVLFLVIMIAPGSFLRIAVFMALCLNLSKTTFSQVRFDPPVSEQAPELSMPWTGGFNAPQFSNIDFNRDGIQDLISFDRQGNILRTYLRAPASGRWILSWDYEQYFPELTDWVKVIDFDKDGVEDIFTSSSATGVAGIRVYKGSYINDTWSFTPLLDRGKSYLQIPAGGDLTNLYVSWDDIPAITDVDKDGDLDVLAFEPGGSFIAYYKNQSVELGWNSDSLRFVLEDFCWGKILENELSEEVFLSDDPDMCSDGQLMEEDPILPRHAGSTVATIDYDFDGDEDAWVGDITSSHLVFLLNGLTPEDAWITHQEPNFPQEDTVIDIPYFVAAYFVELDDDPEPELLAAVNSRALAEDRQSVWRYDDDFADGPLNYNFTQKAWLQDQMIDVGSHSRPAVADVNGDALKDLVIGGYHFTEGPETRIPSLKLYLNTGTATQPYFRLADEDYLSMSAFGSNPTFDFAPAFGDLDGNGSIDLIVGDQNGKLFYYRNTALAGDSMIFDQPVYPYLDINVGVSATPQIADINGDGLADLVIGERTGNADNNGRCSNLNYFQNLGSMGNPIFNPDVNAAPNTGCFGRILFDIPIGLPQYSTPTVFRTDEGLLLMTGGDPGSLNIYTNLFAAITGPATLVEEKYGGLDMGTRSAPILADLNDDDKYELIVGNLRGGLEMFSTDFEVVITSVTDPVQTIKPYRFIHTGSVVKVYWTESVGSVSVVDLTGRVLYQAGEKEQEIQLDLSGLTPGMYLLKMDLEEKSWSEKIVYLSRGF